MPKKAASLAKIPRETTKTKDITGGLPRGVHVHVHEGERVRAGEQLMDGPSNPHDILRVLGEKELQKYLVNEIQEVYRLQGVNINDKHIEVISRQMMRWVRIEDVGDTEFLIDEQTDKFRFLEENERVIQAARVEGKRDDGTSHPSRHGLRVVSARADSGRRAAAAARQCSRPRTISISIARSSTRSTPTSRCWDVRQQGTSSRGGSSDPPVET